MITVRRTLLGISLAIGLLASAGQAVAQGGPPELERELERTEEIIRRAGDMARDAGNAQAAELLKRAVEIQTQARMAYRGGFYDVAASRTRMARELAQRAIALLSNPDQRAERVDRELQRTDELLARAREKLRPGAPESARTLLETAQRQQEQAWELYRGSRLRPALRMTLQVREMLRRLASHLDGIEPDDLQRMFEELRELVRRALDAARDSGNRRALAVAERAQAMLKEAHQSVREGRPHRVRNRLQQVRRLAQQSLRMSGEGVTDTEFEQALQRYEELSSRIAERLAENDNDAARRLYEESREHYRIARELYGEGEDKLWQATAEFRIAQRLMNQARGQLD